MPELITTLTLDELTASVVEALRDEFQKGQPIHEDRLVDRQEMASILNVSIATLDNLVSDDAIPSVKLGARRLFRPSHVLDKLTT